MAAPTTKIRGTFTDSTGAARAGAILKIIPLFAPAPLGGEVIVSNILSVTLDGTGSFGDAAEYSVVSGSYLFVLSDKDTLLILVPLSEPDVTIDISEHIVATSVGSTPLKPYVPSPVTAAQLELLIADASTVTADAIGDAAKGPIMLMFVGETEASTAYDLQTLFNYYAFRAKSAAFLLGNCNPPNGAAANFAANIGNPWVYELTGSGYQRVWSAVGDKDWNPSTGIDALTDAGIAPAELIAYGKVSVGYVDVFLLSSAIEEPSGNTATSVQGLWLQEALSTSLARFKIVAFNKSPRASVDGYNGDWMAWPFDSWGADLVVAAGAKIYERATYGSIDLHTVGTGAATLDTIGTPISGSQFRYNTQKGALFLLITDYNVQAMFVPVGGGDFIATTDKIYDIRQTGLLNLSISHGKGLYYEYLDRTGTNQWVSTLEVDIGPGDDQVIGGWTNFKSLQERTRFVEGLPSEAAVLANPFLEDCFMVVGDDPPIMYYWNKAHREYMVWGSPTAGNSNYLGGGAVMATTIAPTLLALPGEVRITRPNLTCRTFYSFLTGNTFTEVIFDDEFSLTVDIPVLMPWDGIYWLSAYCLDVGKKKSAITATAAVTLRDLIAAV